MAERKKTQSKPQGLVVGDEVDVNDAEFVQAPDKSVATVRSGGTYRFGAAGEYIIGTAAEDGSGITGTTYVVAEQ